MIIKKSIFVCDPGLPSTVIHDGNGADSGDMPVDTGTYNAGSAAKVAGNTGTLVNRFNVLLDGLPNYDNLVT